MGTINYRTSDYLTMGLNPISSYDLENDSGFMEELKQQIDEYGGSIENAIQDYIQQCYEDDLANIENLLEKYTFCYYDIKIEPGYYEGFSLLIENNYGIAYDDYIDKQQALKELTVIKQFLLECAGYGLVVCYPGWCTGYEDYNQTVKTIKQTIKEMKQEVKETPTWNQYYKACGEYP